MRAYKFNPDTKAVKDETINFEFIKKKYTRGCMFGLDNLLARGVYLRGGWCYDFRAELKQYVVKQYGGWHEYYAPNKTLLRNALYGKIDRIIEI